MIWLERWAMIQVYSFYVAVGLAGIVGAYYLGKIVWILLGRSK